MAVNPVVRLQVTITGAVQGVGFRPFVYRLATELNLCGWVNNSANGVLIEVEGAPETLDTFLVRLRQEKPSHSLIIGLESRLAEPIGYSQFEIRHSDASGGKTALILPDIAICPDCLREILDPSNRRYRYPFTNCTNCGPRFSIIEALPYDRPNTTMRHFAMCGQCRAEYENPLDRRFHAQPNACPTCGPHLELWDATGHVIASYEQALLAAAAAIRQGNIVAVKGLGGFHLMVDAQNDDAVRRLRQRKQREEKPFALMFPSLEQVKSVCTVSELEERLLCSSQSPIVLLRCTQPPSPFVAPGNPYLGVMLPYTPLHHLFMAELNFPVVATSGNRSDEPICTDEVEALERLRGLADVFLVHNRPIVRHVDDSIVRVMGGREMVIRRARGYAPLPIHLDQDMPAVVAVGAHLKNTAAVSVGRDVFLSQHIGDLETPQAYDAFQRVIASFEQAYELRPEIAVCDLHPDYLSTQYAEGRDLPLIRVQHHYAHVLACMAENRINAPVLGISWDGTGYGLDGTVWGGEFLLVNPISFERVAHLRTFRLPGGDKAVKEPARTAIGLLYEMYGDDLFTLTELPPVLALSESERTVLRTMLNKGLNAPITSSAGRLFDAVAALIGLCQRVAFEGQAAMLLEYALNGVQTGETYHFELLEKGSTIVVNWSPMIAAILDDVRAGKSAGIIAAMFHNTLVEMMVAVVRQTQQHQVVLSGGCFQNRYLTEHAIDRLRQEGFEPYWHRLFPPNDGSVALGQVVAAQRATREE